MAIAASVGLRTYALLNPVDEPTVTLVFPDLFNFRHTWDFHELKAAKDAYKRAGGCELSAFLEVFWVCQRVEPIRRQPLRIRNLFRTTFAANSHHCSTLTSTLRWEEQQ